MDDGDGLARDLDMPDASNWEFDEASMLAFEEEMAASGVTLPGLADLKNSYQSQHGGAQISGGGSSVSSSGAGAGAMPGAGGISRDDFQLAVGGAVEDPSLGDGMMMEMMFSNEIGLSPEGDLPMTDAAAAHAAAAGGGGILGGKNGGAGANGVQFRNRSMMQQTLHLARAQAITDADLRSMQLTQKEMNILNQGCDGSAVAGQRAEQLHGLLPYQRLPGRKRSASQIGLQPGLVGEGAANGLSSGLSAPGGGHGAQQQQMQMQMQQQRVRQQQGQGQSNGASGTAERGAGGGATGGGGGAVAGGALQKEEHLVKQMKLMKALQVVDYCERDSKAAEVLPGLLIGSIGAAMDLEELLARDVTHVLCVVGGHEKLFFRDHFEYKTLDVKDFPDCDISAHFPACIDFIDR